MLHSRPFIDKFWKTIIENPEGPSRTFNTPFSQFQSMRTCPIRLSRERKNGSKSSIIFCKHVESTTDRIPVIIKGNSGSYHLIKEKIVRRINSRYACKNAAKYSSIRFTWKRKNKQKSLHTCTLLFDTSTQILDSTIYWGSAGGRCSPTVSNKSHQAKKWKSYWRDSRESLLNFGQSSLGNHCPFFSKLQVPYN